MPELPPDIKLKYPDIRLVTQNRIGDVLRVELEEASFAVPTDFDKAILLGTKSRSLNQSIVESTLTDYMSKGANQTKFEIGGWFLAAFWSQDCSPDPKLVTLLCGYIEKKQNSLHTLESLILALASAHKSRTDPAIKERIYQVFQSVVSQPDQDLQEGIIVDAIQRVLQSK